MIIISGIWQDSGIRATFVWYVYGFGIICKDAPMCVKRQQIHRIHTYSAIHIIQMQNRCVWPMSLRNSSLATIFGSSLCRLQSSVPFEYSKLHGHCNWTHEIDWHRIHSKTKVRFQINSYLRTYFIVVFIFVLVVVPSTFTSFNRTVLFTCFDCILLFGSMTHMHTLNTYE